MTIQSPTVRITYACNGVTTLFSVPIQAYNATDFLVLMTNTTNGAVTVLILNSDYTLAPAGSLNPTYWNLITQTGQFASPYASGYELQVVLDPALTQLIQLVPGQAFPSGAIEELGDRPVQMALRLTDQLSRAISAPDGDVSPNMTLPSAAARKLTNLGFDANGNPLCSAILTGQTLTSTELNFLANAVNADGSLALVGSTGGDQGAGTANAAGYFVNGANTVLAAHKTGTTPSTNNTITVDPDLQVNLPSGYTYQVTAFLNVSAGGAGGIQAFIEYLGTTSLNRAASVGRINGANALAQNTFMQSFNYGGSTVQAGDFCLYEGIITTTSANTLGVYWAQNTTNATATSLGPGSYLVATLIH